MHPTADTIFHKSPTPLTTWFYAMYLMSATRCGISAKQIERETGVTYKTAWRMFKQIRSMLDDEKAAPLGGKRGPGVEMDEMYYGGQRKGTMGRPMAGDSKDKKAHRHRNGGAQGPRQSRCRCRRKRLYDAGLG